MVPGGFSDHVYLKEWNRYTPFKSFYSGTISKLSSNYGHDVNYEIMVFYCLQVLSRSTKHLYRSQQETAKDGMTIVKANCKVQDLLTCKYE